MTYKVQINDVVRNATPEETAIIEAAQIEAAQRLQAAKEAQKNKQNALVKLQALGLTDAEIAALVG